VPSKTSRWIDEVVTGDLGVDASEIVAARVVAAVESERGNRWRRGAQRSDGLTEFSTADGLTVLAHVDPLGNEPFGPLVATRNGKLLHGGHIDDLYRSTDTGYSPIHASVEIMSQTAERFHRDRRNLTLDDLKAMPQRSLYLLFEREGGAERHQRFPLAHNYSGNFRHHPYLGNTKVRLVLSGDDADTTHRPIRRDTRSIPREFLGGLPVHPESRPLFGLGQSAAYVDLWPTTSIRTLYDPDTDFHIKTSMNAEVTSANRMLGPEELRWAMDFSRILFDIHERGKLPQGVFVLPELQWISNSRHEHANALIRGGLQDIFPKIDPTDRVVAASSLNTRLPFTDNKTLLEMLIEQNGPQFFDEISKMMISNHLDLLNLGLSHESHGQNTLLIFDKDFRRLKGICIRDVSSHMVDVDQLRKTTGIRLHTTPGDEQVVDPGNPIDQWRVTAKLTHAVVDSQIGIGGATLIDNDTITPEHVRDLVRGTIAAAPAYSQNWLLPAFLKRAGTELLLSGRSDPTYREAESPLWGDPLRPELDPWLD
jgi:hypothetical protein